MPPPRGGDRADTEPGVGWWALLRRHSGSQSCPELPGRTFLCQCEPNRMTAAHSPLPSSHGNPTILPTVLRGPLDGVSATSLFALAAAGLVPNTGTVVAQCGALQFLALLVTLMLTSLLVMNALSTLVTRLKMRWDGLLSIQRRTLGSRWGAAFAVVYLVAVASFAALLLDTLALQWMLAVGWTTTGWLRVGAGCVTLLVQWTLETLGVVAVIRSRLLLFVLACVMLACALLGLYTQHRPAYGITPLVHNTTNGTGNTFHSNVHSAYTSGESFLSMCALYLPCLLSGLLLIAAPSAATSCRHPSYAVRSVSGPFTLFAAFLSLLFAWSLASTVQRPFLLSTPNILYHASLSPALFLALFTTTALAASSIAIAQTRRALLWLFLDTSLHPLLPSSPSRTLAASLSLVPLTLFIVLSPFVSLPLVCSLLTLFVSISIQLQCYVFLRGSAAERTAPVSVAERSRRASQSSAVSSNSRRSSGSSGSGELDRKSPKLIGMVVNWNDTEDHEEDDFLSLNEESDDDGYNTLKKSTAMDSESESDSDSEGDTVVFTTERGKTVNGSGSGSVDKKESIAWPPRWWPVHVTLAWLGALWCVVFMFLLNWYVTLFLFAVFAALHGVLHWTLSRRRTSATANQSLREATRRVRGYPLVLPWASMSHALLRARARDQLGAHQLTLVRPTVPFHLTSVTVNETNNEIVH